MSTAAALLAFARMQASHAAFVASYQTDQRPAAIVESAAADVDFMATMPGLRVWVRADYEPAGAVLGQVSEAYERGDVRTEHGVNESGTFCPATYSLAEALTFFQGAEAALDAACALDVAH